MSIIEKVFHYEENEITVIKCRDEIWFRGKNIAKALGYEKTRNAILKHVNDDDKSILEDLRRGSQIRAPFKNEQGGSKIQTVKGFCHTISLRCCDSIKTMALRLSLVMIITI